MKEQGHVKFGFKVLVKLISLQIIQFKRYLHGLEKSIGQRLCEFDVFMLLKREMCIS